MGKKAKFKEMRRIAKQLPEVKTAQVLGEKVTGAELIKRGITEVDGSPVNTKGSYTGKHSVAVPLNHTRQMKRFYNKWGTNGVKGYIKAVEKHDAEQKAKAAVPTS